MAPVPGAGRWAIASLLALADRCAAAYEEIAAIAPPFKPAGAYINWVRANYEMLARTSHVRARPLKLTVDPTNVCQLQCPLCPTGARVVDREKGHARMHLFRALMNEVGDYVFYIDFFNWGEPLLNPRLEEMIELAAEKRITSRVSSNLSLPLSDERLHRLISSGLGEFVAPVDGASQATYSTYRRRGDFDLAFDNMRRLVALRRARGMTRPLVTWQYLVFKFNEHECATAERWRPRSTSTASCFGLRPSTKTGFPFRRPTRRPSVRGPGRPGVQSRRIDGESTSPALRLALRVDGHQLGWKCRAVLHSLRDTGRLQVNRQRQRPRVHERHQQREVRRDP